MLELMVLGSVGVFLFLKVNPATAAKAAQTSKSTVASPGGTTGTLPQTTKNPASASAARADQGSTAAQPWYSGSTIAIAAGGVASAAAIAGLASLKDIFSTEDSSTDVQDELEGNWDESGFMSSSTDFADPTQSNSFDAGSLDASDGTESYA